MGNMPSNQIVDWLPRETILGTSKNEGKMSSIVKGQLSLYLGMTENYTDLKIQRKADRKIKTLMIFQMIFPLCQTLICHYLLELLHWSIEWPRLGVWKDVMEGVTLVLETKSSLLTGKSSNRQVFQQASLSTSKSYRQVLQ